MSPGDLRLILTARRIDVLKEVAEEIKKEVGEGVKVLPVKLDMADAGAIRGFVGELPQEWRDVDVLVNNAYVVCYLSSVYLSLLSPTGSNTPRTHARMPQKHS